MLVCQLIILQQTGSSCRILYIFNDVFNTTMYNYGRNFIIQVPEVINFSLIRKLIIPLHF